MAEQDVFRGTPEGDEVRRLTKAWLEEREHQMTVSSEPEDYGDRGAEFHIRSTRRAWISECSCGWHAGSGIGYAWFRTKRDAIAAWREHTAEHAGQADRQSGDDG